MQLNEIIEKIKDILSSEQESKVFDKDVAAALSLSKDSLSHMKRKNSIPYEQIAKFCAKRKISINWVLYDQFPRSLEENTEKYTKIRYLSKINASAGGGSFNYEEQGSFLLIEQELLDSLYRSKKIDTSSLMAINVHGDSMEPTLKDSEIILIDKEEIDISSGGVFVISTNTGLFVKRPYVDEDGNIQLLSDNRDYTPHIICKDEQESVLILGKVVCSVGVDVR